MKAATPRQQKIAAVYDADIWPLLPQRAAESILRRLPAAGIARSRILEIGAATGRLTLALAARLDETGRVLALESSPAMVDVAEATKGGHAEAAKVSFELAEMVPPWPSVNGVSSFDVAVSNLALADTPEPAAAVAAMARALKAGGHLLITLPLRGSWTEFLDLYADVLTEQGKREGLTALRAYRVGLPTADVMVAWFESAGLRDVTVEVERWELLFKSAREFFFAPVIEMGPLPTWKQIAGGRGDEMQDVFYFVKEAIETYFAGTVFPVTMVIGCVRGIKPATTK